MAESFVAIGRFQFVYQAELARLHLEEAGIPAFVRDSETVTADWFLANAVGYVKVEVAAEDEERGREVLSRMTVPKPDPGIGGSESRCLVCHAPMPTGQDRCPECGWTFLDEAEGDMSPPQLSAEEELRQSEPLSFEPLFLICTGIVVGTLAVLIAYGFYYAGLGINE